jgi:hypothetical protein
MALEVMRKGSLLGHIFALENCPEFRYDSNV